MKNPSGIHQRFLPVSFRILVVQALLLTSAPVTAPAFQPQKPGEQAAAGSLAPAKLSRLEISYSGDRLVIFSDALETAGNNLHRAKGNVTITFLDVVLTCEEAEYDEVTMRVSSGDPTRFRSRRVSLTSAGAVFDPAAQTVTLKDASGYYYETSGRSDREFFLTGGMSRNIKAEKLDIRWGAGQSTVEPGQSLNPGPGER